MKILIAEDDARLLKSLLHIFTLNKFSADGVSNGKEALEYALTGEYDGLVLDIMMPGMDGIEVLKALRKENITTPALFLTARTEVSQRVDGLDAGADELLWGIACPSDAVLDMWKPSGKKSVERKAGTDGYSMYVRIMKSVAEIMNGV